jgi:hypothetical protein
MVKPLRWSDGIESSETRSDSSRALKRVAELLLAVAIPPESRLVKNWDRVTTGKSTSPE